MVKNLPVGCTFNIIKFGSTYELLWPDGVEVYDSTAVQYAEQWMEQIYANLGGTNILSPIDRVVNTKTADNRVKQIFLLTDGSVGNQYDIIRTVSSASRQYVDSTGRKFPNFYNNRVFTLAIGSHASQSLCRELAEKSHGMESCDQTNIAEHSGRVPFHSSSPDDRTDF